MKEGNLKEYIADLRDKILDNYKKNPLQIFSDYGTEQEKIDEYNGRQLLELIQNADDAAAPAQEKVCFISLKEETLIVANNGEKFSQGGFESLMYSNLSPKAIEQNKIGQKGLGFRSVLSWANKVTIKSYDFAVEFSEQNAHDIFDNIVKENPQIIEVKTKKGFDANSYPIAILRCPKLLERTPSYSNYDTYIVLDLKKDQVDKVKEQIQNEIDMELLLFLNNLNKIVVEYPDGNFTITKEVNNKAKTISVVRSYDGGNSETKEWHIRTKSGELAGRVKGQNKQKKYELKIAWNDKLDNTNNVLYSYFKTNVPFPFPALVHGTFDLTSDRNHLMPQNDFNDGLKNKLKDFIIEIAVEIAKKKVSYNPLKLLCISPNDFLSQVDLIDEIKKSNARIFPSVSENYISFNENPFFLANDYASLIEDKDKLQFTSLLQHTTDQKLVALLENLNIVKAPDNDFVEMLSNIQLNIEKRAKAIYWFTGEKFVYYKPDNLSKILIDDNGHSCSRKDELFLPPSGVSLKIPDGFSLKIINAALYYQLRSLFNESNADAMASRLKIFNVRAYQFASVFNSIVQKEGKSSSDDQAQFNSGLLQKLYELYSENKHSGVDINIASIKTNIYVLNRCGEVVKTTNVYLGKEYGNDLCEQLYHYDENKFVASPSDLDLKNEADVKEFLLWLQVADKPRYKLVDVEKEYGDYVLDLFPFSEKNIWGNTRKDMDDYNYNSIKAHSIDGFSDILENNNNETIVNWLLKDTRIITNTKEISGSYIKFHKYNGKKYPEIQYMDMPSYLLWKLSRTKWLNTPNGKVEPLRCCLNKSIGDEFSPLIEVPIIDYSKIEGRKYDTDHTLHTIGVKIDIKEFPLEAIYSILYKLSEKGIDSEGKRAKSIYRELVENFDEDDLDNASPERQKFLESGKVLCKKDNAYSYQSVKDVFYLQDKIYGENIVSQFYTIAVDRRRNSTVVKKLFGVEPLANLKFSLSNKVAKNDVLNTELQEDLKKLNPYIFALRNTSLRSSNTKDTNYSKLSEKWNVVVCSQLTPMYKKTESDPGIVFTLNDYEFVYVSEENTYYVLLSNSSSRTLEELKTDFRFVDVIAEIYSNILKVDSIRPFVSRLFEANAEKRKYLIKSEIDDSDSALDEARKKLNIVNDTKVLFWLNILKTKNCDAEYKDYENSELEGLIKDKLDICIDDYAIDYDELKSKNCNVPIVKDLFVALSIDVESFNKSGLCDIDFLPYYKEEFSKMKRNHEPLFKGLLYDQLKKETIDKKKKFINIIQQYSHSEDISIANPTDVNIENVFQKYVKQTYHVDLSVMPTENDITELYQRNYENLKSQLDKYPNIKSFIDDDDEMRSLVYFNEFDEIIRNYTSHQQNPQSKNTITVNGESIKADSPEEIFKQLSNLSLDCSIDPIDIEKIPITNRNRNSSGRKIGGKTGISHISDKRKKEIGFTGETVVYNSLKKKYGEKNVSWESGYAKEANVNPLGDDMNHYDLWFEENGERKYVEVKSTNSDNLEFEISEAEFEFGVTKGESYMVFIVTNVESKDRKIKNIGNPFIFKDGESLTSNPRFTMLNDKFIIKMKESNK